MEMGSKFTLNPHEIHTKFGRQFRRNSQGDFSHDFSKFTRDFGHGFRREGKGGGEASRAESPRDPPEQPLEGRHASLVPGIDFSRISS